MSASPSTGPSAQIDEAGAHEVRAWLLAMQDCVRTLDFDRARALFAGDVRAFGTRASAVGGLDELELEQWRLTWPTIRDFTFRLDGAHVLGDRRRVTVFVEWTSQGHDGAGMSYERPGRATLVLERRHERLVAVHSHFSLVPE